MPDGLGMLDEQRQRRTRTIPAPRNRPRATPVEVVPLPAAAAQPVEPEPPAVDETAVGESAARQSTSAGRAAPLPAPAGQATSTAAVEPPVKMSIYLESSDDMYLEEVTHAGKTSRPRVAISRSAIVRLALQRLAATMSTDEIVAELRQRGDEHQGTGRKRR